MCVGATRGCAPMLYGSRGIRRAATGIVAAALIAELGLLASTALPRAAAAEDSGPGLPAATAPATKVEAETIDREALDTAVLRKPAPLPATVQPAVTIGSTAAKTSSSGGSRPSSGSELAQARAILAGLIRKYPILKGTTVKIGDTPGDYQAVAYYQSGRIVVSPDHKASLQKILNHEVWHIIDWRDNGRIDWGENVPPR